MLHFAKQAKAMVLLFLHHSNYSLVAYQFLNVLALNDETQLMDQLRFGSRYVRPVANSSEALEVKHGIALQKIEYVDTYSNVLNVNVWENYVSKEIISL